MGNCCFNSDSYHTFDNKSIILYSSYLTLKYSNNSNIEPGVHLTPRAYENQVNNKTYYFILYNNREIHYHHSHTEIENSNKKEKEKYDIQLNNTSKIYLSDIISIKSDELTDYFQLYLINSIIELKASSVTSKNIWIDTLRSLTPTIPFQFRTLYAGNVNKQGHMERTSWKSRFMILTESHLFYFANENCSKLFLRAIAEGADLNGLFNEAISLEYCTAHEVGIYDNRPLVFSVQVKGSLKVKDTTYFFQSSDVASSRQWVERINLAISTLKRSDKTIDLIDVHAHVAPNESLEMERSLLERAEQLDRSSQSAERNPSPSPLKPSKIQAKNLNDDDTNDNEEYQMWLRKSSSASFIKHVRFGSNHTRLIKFDYDNKIINWGTGKIAFDDIIKFTLSDSLLKFAGNSRNLELECSSKNEAKEWARLITKYCKKDFIKCKW